MYEPPNKLKHKETALSSSAALKGGAQSMHCRLCLLYFAVCVLYYNQYATTGKHMPLNGFELVVTVCTSVTAAQKYNI